MDVLRWGGGRIEVKLCHVIRGRPLEVIGLLRNTVLLSWTPGSADRADGGAGRKVLG